MLKPRAQLVSLEATAYYHCISRCVRRPSLCGHDRVTGQSVDHRKQWLVERLQELTAVFAIDICAYGLMSNHFHVLLHVDRARALGWSEAEVAARYARLFPNTVTNARRLPAEAWGRTVARWRARLWDLSWFMRCLNEAIARRANREEHCTGRFWEGRFRSQALLDAGALLTCMSYVDLNPIRAGLATTLEEAAFTSIRERLLAAARGETIRLVPFAEAAGAAGGPAFVLRHGGVTPCVRPSVEPGVAAVVRPDAGRHRGCRRISGGDNPLTERRRRYPPPPAEHCPAHRLSRGFNWRYWVGVCSSSSCVRSTAGAREQAQRLGPRWHAWDRLEGCGSTCRYLPARASAPRKKCGRAIRSACGSC